MKPAAPVTKSLMSWSCGWFAGWLRWLIAELLAELLAGVACGGGSGAHRPVRPAVRRDVGTARVLLVPLGEDRVGDAPVGIDGRVVPGHAELVGRVVVPV